MIENLKKNIKELNNEYEEVKEKINVLKANGNLSKLYNLREEFDETFDTFFDDIDIRKKYNDYDYENECIKFEKSNNDILEELDKNDLENYIEFYINYIGVLDDELIDLEFINSFNGI